MATRTQVLSHQHLVPRSFGEACGTQGSGSGVSNLYSRRFLQLVDTMFPSYRVHACVLCTCVYSLSSKYLSSALGQAPTQALEIKQFTGEASPLVALMIRGET